MKSVRVLILCSSDSTFFYILRALKESRKYRFTIFGYGTNNEFIQQFHEVEIIRKQPSDVNLASFLLAISSKYKIDIILPASSEYIEVLCQDLEKFRNVNTEPIIPVSDPSLLEILSSRPALFEYSSNVLSIPVPEYQIVKKPMMLEDSMRSLGYHQKPILLYSSLHSQRRNIRLVDSSKDIHKLFFDEKPDAVYTTLQQFNYDIGEDFKEILAIEYDCMAEYSIEVLCRKGQSFVTLVYPSNPLSDKMNTFTVLTKDQYFSVIEDLVHRVVEGFGLSYSVSMRIWIDSEGTARLIDVIPHLRNSVILCLHGGVNFPELMIDMALREFDYNFRPAVKWGLKIQQVWLELLNYQGVVWKTEM